MSFFQFLRSRRTWIGALLFVLACVLLDALGALLIVRGILPMTSETAWVWGSAGAAAFCTGLYVMNGSAVLPMSGTLWSILMLLLISAGSLCPGRIVWGKSTLVTAGTMLAGLILAGLMSRGGSGKHRKRAGKRPAQKGAAKVRAHH